MQFPKSESMVSARVGINNCRKLSDGCDAAPFRSLAALIPE